MTVLQDVLSKLPLLTPPDRGRVLDELLSGSSDSNNDDTPAIVKTPDVCGGSARLVRTRIPVWTVERFRQLGANDAEILYHFPTLQPSDLPQALRYVARNRDEIEREIEENERE